MIDNQWIRVIANSFIFFGLAIVVGGIFFELVDIIVSMFKGEEYAKGLLSISFICITIGVVIRIFFRNKTS